MGQYYQPVMIDRNNEITTATSFDFGNGQKLMEHSWINNMFVNAVLNKLLNNPCRLGWVGDYSDDSDIDKSRFDFDFMEIFNNVWGKCRDKYKYLDGSCDFVYPNFVVVNHIKKEYIDFGEYIDNNDDNGWCINPVPLLTCIGNGLGGGDYDGTNMELIGTWCFDEIEFILKADKPDGYKNITSTISFEKQSN